MKLKPAVSDTSSFNKSTQYTGVHFVYTPAGKNRSARVRLAGILEDIIGENGWAEPDVLAQSLITDSVVLPKLQSLAAENAGDDLLSKEAKILLQILLPYLEELKSSQKLLESSGAVAFRHVPLMFPVGSAVVYSDGMADIAGILKSCKRVHGLSGPYYAFGVEYFAYQDGSFKLGMHYVNVAGFEGSKPKEAIALRILTEERKLALCARGSKVAKACEKPYFKYLNGTGYQLGWFGTPVAYKIQDRVVVDYACASAEDAETGPLNWRASDEDFATGNSVPDAELWRVNPILPAYSLRRQQWYLVDIDALTDIKFNDAAFSKLVMDADTKDMVRCISAGIGGAFADFISDKGGGAIFLLHGPPGTGKTSLAEVTAESLHKPLCMIGAADLGTHAPELEHGLKKYLRRAERWGAVLLIDEADVFMEARTSSDIERNALVSVFLRTLEYYSGTMFLTTNRVKGFDPAFFSRISVSVEYTDMTVDTREQVWNNLLAEANVSIAPEIVKNTLRDIQINGRQIKNAIRMASVMAKSAERTVNTQDLLRFTTRAANFDKIGQKD